MTFQSYTPLSCANIFIFREPARVTTPTCCSVCPPNRSTISLLAVHWIERGNSGDCKGNGSEHQSSSNHRVQEVLQGWGHSSFSNQWVGHHGSNSDGHSSHDLLDILLLNGTATHETYCKRIRPNRMRGQRNTATTLVSLFDPSTHRFDRCYLSTSERACLDSFYMRDYILSTKFTGTERLYNIPSHHWAGNWGHTGGSLGGNCKIQDNQCYPLPIQPQGLEVSGTQRHRT